MMDIATRFTIAADGLHHPERDQRRQAGREAAQQRPEREQHQSDLEGLAAADPVGGRACQHQQARDHQRIRGHDPLQPRDAGVQVVLDRGQRDVDHSDVEPDDEQAHAAGREHEHPPGATQVSGHIAASPSLPRHPLAVKRSLSRLTNRCPRIFRQDLIALPAPGEPGSVRVRL
jgi:hypothetical protein